MFLSVPSLPTQPTPPWVPSDSALRSPQAAIISSEVGAPDRDDMDPNIITTAGALSASLGMWRRHAELTRVQGHAEESLMLGLDLGRRFTFESHQHVAQGSHKE